MHTNDPFCCPNSPLQSSYIWFAGWPKPYSYRRAQNRLNNSRVKLCHVRLWQVELFQLTKKVHSLLGLFHDGVNVSVPLQVLRDGGSQEPEWLHSKSYQNAKSFSHECDLWIAEFRVTFLSFSVFPNPPGQIGFLHSVNLRCQEEVFIHYWNISHDLRDHLIQRLMLEVMFWTHTHKCACS